uniref:Uncharacterized protein n=1 Tax=Timema bartmani TaxID=61472 RepID=A0A7R9EX60_9NEOP|nr:unnamed protein product [Timema bartmani]
MEDGTVIREIVKVCDRLTFWSLRHKRRDQVALVYCIVSYERGRYGQETLTSTFSNLSRRSCRSDQNVSLYFCNTLKKSVNCYTLEVSFHGYQSPNTTDMCYYTEEAYCRLGRNVVRTYLDYYRVVGVVPAGLPTAPSSPEPRPRTNSSRSPSSRSRPRSRPHTTKGQAPTTYVLSLNDLEGSTSRESSPEEKGPRRVAAMSHERYQVTPKAIARQ